MQTSDEYELVYSWLKDALFNDQDFAEFILHYGDEALGMIKEFRSHLRWQLENLKIPEDSWKRQVTALIIRSKFRIRQLEGAANVKENRNR